MEITRFTCHAMTSVSCGSTMLLKMALKTGKLRKLSPNNQLFLSKDLQHIKSGTGKHEKEILDLEKNGCLGPYPSGK